MDISVPISAGLSHLGKLHESLERIDDLTLAPGNRRRAVEELSSLIDDSGPNPSVLGALDRALSDSNKWIQSAAVIALERLGAASEELVDHLCDLLRYPNEMAWLYIPAALDKILDGGQKVDDEVFMLLHQCIWHDSPRVRKVAHTYFDRFCEKNREDLSYRVRHLKESLSGCIDISGIDKALLLTELYNNAVDLNEYENTSIHMNYCEASKILTRRSQFYIHEQLYLTYDRRLSFEILRGRAINVDITGEILDKEQYDKVNGDGAAENAVEMAWRKSLRTKGPIEKLLGIFSMKGNSKPWEIDAPMPL